MIVSTPGVYIKEINTLPASIVGASTAVPAFIGFTEITPAQHSEWVTGDPYAPVEIKNLEEFEASFGGKHIPKFTPTLSGNDVTEVIPDVRFFLYDSLELYFRNGGGPCFILSAGKFSSFSSFTSNIDRAGALSIQLASLDLLPEVTVVSIPDLNLEFKDGTPAIKANISDQFSSVFHATIDKCGTLKDKFAIFDFPTRSMTANTVRSKINVSENRMYGAMYYPWLKKSNPYALRVGDITFSTTPSNPSPEKIAYDEIKLDFTNAVAAFGSERTVQDMKDKFSSYRNAIDQSTTSAKGPFTNPVKYLIDLILDMDSLTLSNAEIINFRQNLSSNDNLSKEIKALFWFKKIADDQSLLLPSASSGSTLLNSDWYTESGDTYTSFSDFENDSSAPSYVINSDLEGFDDLASGTIVDLNIIFEAVANLFKTIEFKLDQAEKALFAQDPIYSNIQKAVESYMQVVPSQGAIAGIYCKVDRERGVWKSPANVAVQGIDKPLREVSNSEQNSLNEDADGKAINVIRTFTGKGPLVWGARTLDSTSNEWRYVSVRRFFSFAEKSIKDALSDFVLEPNNTHTWVKIKAMVTSFLVGQWQAGALVGITMSEAFFVKVDETTADVLNGTVDVQVGLAVVRPAEFIILTFSHKTK